MTFYISAEIYERKVKWEL